MPAFREMKTYRGQRLRLDLPDLLEHARFELSRNRPLRLEMSGPTMRPTIEEGDILTIEPVEVTAVRPQDIVLYATSSGTAVVQRVIALEERAGCVYAIMRGDRAELPGTPIALHQILGRVVAIERRRSGRTISLKRRPSLRMRMWDFFRRLFRGRRG
ncbi:hypothetical protein HRbin08_01972 [bacterium HR08]|nr:hypothetical protein HRbin08_01972 [bacterium HR08]